MDLDGGAKGPTTPAVASAESTVVAEKAGVLPEKTEKEVTTSAGKNGSAPDSTEVKGKSSEVEQSTKDDLKTLNPEDTGSKEMEQNAASSSSSSSSSRHKEMTPEEETDEVLLRLEALEKGEDPEKIGDKKKHPEWKHQNGGNSEMPPSSSGAPKKASSTEQSPPASSKEESGPAEKSAEAVSSNAKRKHSLSEPETSTEPQTKKVHVGDVIDSPEGSVAKAEVVETRSSPAKAPSGQTDASSAGPSQRAVDSMEEAVEKPPSVEKMDVDGSPEPETSSPDNLDTLPDTEPNTESEEKLEEISSSNQEPTRSDAADKVTGKSDHSNVSSSDDKRSGPNEKAKPPDSEVSASTVPTPSQEEAMEVDEDDDTDMAECSTSAGAASAVPVAEPLCVKKVAYLCTDEDKTDGPKKDVKKSPAASPAKPAVASTSAASVATPVAAITTQEKLAKVEIVSHTKAHSSSSTSTGKPQAAQSAAVVVDSSRKPASEKPPSATRASDEAVVVDSSRQPASEKPPSATRASDEVVVVDSSHKPSTEKPSSAAVASKEAVMVDSSHKPSPAKPSSGAHATEQGVMVDSSNKQSSEKPSSAGHAQEEGVVESSQPSSSSDSKKQQSDNRLNEQLREAVHRSGLLAKAGSTPNSSASLATSSPVTPKTLNPVTTSAVSSSNVYSSTPIHANFTKVPSGNVSKITNPPSSVETSRVEADDTTVAATTLPATDQSSSIVAAGEGKETTTSTSTATASTTKSSPSVTPSKGADTAIVPTGSSTAKCTPPKKDLSKREESYRTSSSSLKTTDSSEVDSCTVASAMNTAEEINMYTANARKFNGISSTSEGSDMETKGDVLKSLKPVKVEDDTKVSLSSTVTHLDLSGAISPSTPAEQQYEVSVWYEGKDLQFLAVERILGGKVESSSFGPCTTAGTTAVTQDTSSVIDSSSKQSSSTTTTNGSVTSLGPFTLSEKRASVVDASAHSSDSSSASATAAAAAAAPVVEQHSAMTAKSTASVPQIKHTVTGPRALCDMLIEEFKKLRRNFAPEEEDETRQRSDDEFLNTPKTSGGFARGQRSGSGASKKSAAARGHKRSKMAADSDDDGDDASSEQRTPRASGTTKQSAKKVKSSESPPVTSTATTPKPKVIPERQKQQFDICCLARWTDRKYYAGRVTNYRGDNKFVVVFEDGCSKTLSRDIIVFGEDGVLPILHHSIHALSSGDTYEPAIVVELKRGAETGEVVYGVRTATGALEVTATDIYLTDEQAKWIHHALKDKPDPMQQLLQSAAGAEGANHPGGDGLAAAADGASKGDSVAASEHGTESAGDKNARSTRSKRGAGDKSMTPGTPEAGYSGGVGKKGRRGRRKQLPPPEPNISECSDVSDGYEEEVPTPLSPETGLDAVDGVQPELQRTEQESELTKMRLVSQYFGDTMSGKDEANLNELLGPIPVGAKTLFRNKHFLLSCTIPHKMSSCNGDSTEASKYKQFSNIPFVKQHLRRQIEAGGGKVYHFFEDVPKNKYKLCKLIAPRPSTTALYVQCLACDIPAVSHEWIVQCCQVLMLVDHKPYALPCGWSFLERRYIDWGCGRAKDKRNSATPFASTAINVASLCKDFNDFWSRVCKLGGATVRLIKTESDVTENLTGYLLTDQEFPEEIKIKAARNGLLVVSTVWVVQCLIVGRVCHPKSHEKLTQIYQEDDY
uniref:BRCT domain-containing protein n=1 Tax=Anopheles atroparvus TaxID=41427 RepID=A0A182J355_ANOAO